MDERWKPELLRLPKDSQLQIVPPHFDTLWQIAQEVAERDSTCPGDIGFDDVPLNYFCPFCGAQTLHSDRVVGKDFPHVPSCIVTKARESMEWRKQQQQLTIKVTQSEVLPSMQESAKWIVERFNIPPQIVMPIVVDAEVKHD